MIQLIKRSPFTPFWTNFGQKIPQKLAKMVYFSVKIPRGPRNKIPGDGEFKKTLSPGIPRGIFPGVQP